MDPQELEDELAANAKAPRVTKQQIDEMINASPVQYWQPHGTTVTVCCITVVPSGYNLIGSSACASPDNEEIGRKLAHERAADQLWELEGYRLRCELAGAP